LSIHLPSTRSAPAPANFAIPASRSSLPDLIRTLAATKAAAEAACTAQSRAEEKHRTADGKLARPARPKVCGGMTEPIVIEVGGRHTEQPACEWFFSSREEIEKSGTPDHLADWDRQVKANASAYPKEVQAAERAAERALDAWTSAERALVRYRPTTAAEATELLQLAGAPTKKGVLYLDIDDHSLKTIVKNCATALLAAARQ
jgi:hypothetical protein